MLSVELEGQEYVALHNLLFLRPVHYLFAEVSTRDPQQRLLFQVAQENGSRILTFSSDIVVHNLTQETLHLQLEAPMLPPFALPPLAPGAHTPLPLRYAVDAHLRVRPPPARFQWSQEKLHCHTHMMKSRAPPFLTCPAPEGTAPWLYAVEREGPVTRRLGLSFEEGKQQVHIRLRAPFHLDNALPCPLSYRVSTAQGALLTSGTLPVGEGTDIFQVQADHRPVLQVQLPEWKWSEGKKVGPSNKAYLTVGREGAPDQLKIYLQNDTSAGSGARHTTVYVPFWLHNQTGTKLYYKPLGSGLLGSGKTFTAESSIVTPSSEDFYYPGREQQAVQALLEGRNSLFVKPTLWSERQVLVRSNHTEWSKEISLQRGGVIVNLKEKATNLTLLSSSSSFSGGQPSSLPAHASGGLPSHSSASFSLSESETAPPAMHQYGLTLSTAPGRFWRTAVATIRPYCLLINKSRHALSFQQHEVSATQIDVPPQRQVPFHWFHYKAPHHLQVSAAPRSHLWSLPFFLEAAGSFQLPLGCQVGPEPVTRLRIKINAAPASLIATFWEAEGDEPDYLLVNASPYEISVGQMDTPESIPLPAHSSAPYAWCAPLLSKRKLHVTIAHSQAALMVSLDKLRHFTPLTWVDGEGASHTLALSLTADGLKKILKLRRLHTGPATGHALPRPRLSLRGSTGKGALPVQATGTVLDQRQYQQVNEPRLTVGLELEGISLSLIDETPQEILLLSLGQLQLLYCQGADTQSLQMNVGAFQIDNQLINTPFPVLLHSPPVPGQPFFELSVLRSTRYSHLRYIPYFALRFQAMHVRVDEDCLIRTLRLADSITSYLSSRQQTQAEAQIFLTPPLYEVDADAYEPHGGTALYFELLHINPIRINLSFCTSGASKSPGTPSMLERSLRAGGFLANIDGAPLRLNGLILENPMGTQAELVSRISKHYTRQLITETHKILGASDILGSPVSLVSSLGTGVYDFFHEPIEGNVANPRDFAAGLARGTESLVKNSVFGIFNSVSKISGSLSKAATTISMDDDWQRKRARKFRQKPGDVGEGLSRGFLRLGTGIFDGVTGVVAQPIKQVAAQPNAAGLARGVGKGLSGLFLRPAVGVVDLITDATEGIKNAAGGVEGTGERKRAPRYFGPDHILTPCNTRASNLQLLLRTTEHGRFEEQYFLGAWAISSEQFLLLSDQRLFCFPKVGSSLKKLSSVKLIDVRVVRVVKQGLLLQLRDNTQTLYGTSVETAKTIRTAVNNTLLQHNPTPENQLQYHLREDAKLVGEETNEARALLPSPHSDEESPLPSPLVSHRPRLNSTSSLEGSPLSWEPSRTQSMSSLPDDTSSVYSADENTPLYPRKLPPRQEDRTCCTCSLL